MLVRRGAVGAGAGGIQAAGSSEADLTKGEVGDFAKDVGVGAGIGAITPTALHYGGAGLARAGDAVSKTTKFVSGLGSNAADDSVKGAAKILGVKESEITPEIVEYLKKHGLGLRANKEKMLAGIDDDIAAEINKLKNSPDVAKESLVEKLQN
jgi:hypothetical protein